MIYRAPLRDIEFCLAHLVGADRLAGTARFEEATAESRSAVIESAGRIASETLAPLNRASDQRGARLENGVVRCTPGFAEAYGEIASGGWIGIAAGAAYGGMGLPQTFACIVNDLFSGACLSLALNPLMTQGQIEALEAHASDEIKALYLPKLVSGRWTGTMNLTEPQAGTDVGALRTTATPADDGTYRLTGQKIYISWGDHDMAENVCHLVLARTPGAPAGTRGLSLFLAPKRLPDESGAPGRENALRAISLEEKLGLHGSPTAVMEYDGATAWLIGEEHRGMACMFTMMNNARLGVGLQGVGVAEAAFQKAAAYAADRVQGRAPAPGGTGTILDHADVRRMLMTMKTQVEAARAIAYDCAVSIDLSNADAEAEARSGFAARAAFLTPIAKAFGTDTGCEVASLGVQIHGGMGYVEETGAAQFWRDVRVTAIYEGTNGVQAMDLVGRKLADGGAAARALLGEIDACAGALRAEGGAFAALGAGLAAAARALRDATEALLAMSDANARFAGATPYLRMWALTLGAKHLATGALAARSATGEDGAGADGEAEARLSLARFFVLQRGAEVAGLAAAATAGAAPLYALAPERLVS